jgi:hypothetical protein
VELKKRYRSQQIVFAYFASAVVGFFLFLRIGELYENGGSNY